MVLPCSDMVFTGADIFLVIYHFIWSELRTIFNAYEGPAVLMLLLGATPLVFAVQGTGSEAVVSLLLNHGADANKADNCGIAPLHIAAEQGSLCSCMNVSRTVLPVC